MSISGLVFKTVAVLGVILVLIIIGITMASNAARIALINGFDRLVDKSLGGL